MSTEFEEGVEIEAKKINPKKKEEEVEKRRDMRGEMTFTIDPEDAKDLTTPFLLKSLAKTNMKWGYILQMFHTM